MKLGHGDIGGTAEHGFRKDRVTARRLSHENMGM